MTDSGMKDKLASTKKLFGAAATLAKKKAALATLNNVTLPKIYYAIGKRLVGLAQLPPELAALRDKIRSLEAQIAAVPAKETSEAATGLAAKAKQLAQQAAKATSDAAATAQIHAAYVSLGKAAVDKYGDKSVPKEVLPDLQQANRSIAELKEEIATLGAASGKGIVTPGRLLLAGGLGIAVLLGFVFLRLFSGNDSPAGRSAAVAVAETNSESTEHKQRTSTSLEEMRAGTQRKLDAIKKGAENDRFRSQVQRQLSEWQTAAEQLKGSLLREPQLLATFEGDAAGPLRELAAEKSQELEKAYTDMWRRLRSDSEDRSGDEKALAEATADMLADSLAAFTAACNAEKSRLSQLRKAAIASLLDEQASARSRNQADIKDISAFADTERKRWHVEASKARVPLADDPRVKGLKKPNDVDQLALRIKEAEDAFARVFLSQEKAVSERAARCVSEVTKQHKVGKGSRGASDTAKQDLTAFVTESVSSLLNEREQKILQIKAAAENLLAFEASTQGLVSSDKVVPRVPEKAARHYRGPANITDGELSTIIKDGPDITDFSLERCEKLTDRSLAALATVTDLRSLTLCDEAVFSANGFKALRGKKLESVTVPSSLLNDPDAFATYVSLLKTPDGPPPQKVLTSFREDLYDLDIGDKGLTHLRGVRGINTLVLPKGTTDRGLAMLADLPDLQALTVVLNASISDKGIASLRRCKHLKELRLFDNHRTPNSTAEKTVSSPVSADGLRGLKGLNLELFEMPLWMMEENFFEPFLDALTEDSEGRRWDTNSGGTRYWLNIRSRDATSMSTLKSWPNTPQVFAALSGKRGIRVVTIRDCKCSEEDLRKLGQLADLTDLRCERVEFGGEGFDTLAGAKSLEHVTIENCPKLTDSALRGLSQCSTLESLKIWHSPLVTDEGLLGVAKGCKQLKRLDINDTGATAPVQVKLENALPKCDVIVQ